jgi:hypothetical protein
LIEGGTDREINAKDRVGGGAGAGCRCCDCVLARAQHTDTHEHQQGTNNNELSKRAALGLTNTVVVWHAKTPMLAARRGDGRAVRICVQ